MKKEETGGGEEEERETFSPEFQNSNSRGNELVEKEGEEERETDQRRD